MEGNLSGRRVDLDRTDKLPILSEENLLDLGIDRESPIGEKALATEAWATELWQALEAASQRTERLEGRLEAQNRTIARLRQELDRRREQESPPPAAPQRGDDPPPIPREVIGKIQSVLRTLHKRIATIETYVAGRPEGWREMEQALHAKTLRLTQAEAQLAEKIALLAKELVPHRPDDATHPSRGEPRVDEVPSRDTPDASPVHDEDATMAAPQPLAPAATGAERPKPASGRIPALVGLSPDAPVACALDKQSITIGRDPDCDIRIPSESVSWKHAVLFRDGTAIILEDKSSTNGVLVNGVRVRRQTLAHGDAITIGGAEFRFVNGEARE